MQQLIKDKRTNNMNNEYDLSKPNPGQPQPSQFDPQGGAGSQQMSIDPIVMNNISSSIGWAKFIGIMGIIGGAISCLGIITAAIGIPAIIASLNVLKGADFARQFAMQGDYKSAFEALSKYSLYFKIMGIVTLIAIILYVILIIIYAVFFGAMIGQIGAR
jgi:hypothetical protein